MKKFLICCLLVAVGWFGTAYYQYEKTVFADNGLIRLHIVANSDDIFDQQVKLLIRDAIIEEMGETLGNVESPEEAERTVRENLPRIEAIANGILNQYTNYTAKAELGEFQFPTRSYGEFALPAGEYTALRVVLGEGEGKNWWCVLFPPLCFVDQAGSIAQNPDRVEQGEKDAVAVSTGEEKGGIVVKSKLHEIFREKDKKSADSEETDDSN